MKNTLTKIFLITLTTVLLIGAMAGISVFAQDAEADTYEIKSINVIHDEKAIVLIAVDLPSETEQTAAPDVVVDYTLNGESKTAKFHSYRYIEKYGAYYPVYYTVGIAPVDICEAVTAVAYKTGAAQDASKAKSTSLAEYLYTRLYRDDVISATEGDDLDRRGMYLALLEYGSYAQNVFWNNKAENADNQRTLANELIYVTANGATVNGVDGVLLDKSAAVTFAGAPAAPAEYKQSGWQVTTYDAKGNVIETSLLDSTTYTAASTAVIAPTYARAWEDYEDGASTNSIDNTGGGATASIVTDGENKYYTVVKPADTKTGEFIYIANNGIDYADGDCTVFETKIRVTYDYAYQGSFNIYYGRYNGMKKITFSNEANSTALKIDDWRDGYSTTLSGDSGVNVGEWFTLRIENYLNASGETIARVYINGVYFGESTNAGVLGAASTNHNLNTVTVVSNNNMLNGSVDLDDTYFGEGKMKTFDEVANDFENSTVASTGGKVSASNVTVTPNGTEGSAVSIATDGDNSYLDFAVVGGVNNITILPTYPATADSDLFVYEADVKIDSHAIFNLFGNDSSAKPHQIYFYNNSGKHGLNLGSSITDTDGKSDGWYSTPLVTGDWFKLRIEQNGTNLKVYINGELFKEATTVSTASAITKVQVYTFGGATGSICLDNIKAGFIAE